MVTEMRVILDMDSAEVTAQGLTRAFHLVASIPLDKFPLAGRTLACDSLGHGFVGSMDRVLESGFFATSLLTSFPFVFEIIARDTVIFLATAALNGWVTLILGSDVCALGTFPDRQSRLLDVFAEDAVVDSLIESGREHLVEERNGVNTSAFLLHNAFELSRAIAIQLFGNKAL